MTSTDWVVEYIASKVPGENGVQKKLNVIAQQRSFQSNLKKVCEELEVPESGARNSQKLLYSRFSEGTHKGGFEKLKVYANCGEYSPTIAASFLAYLREYNIPHLYVVRGDTLKWLLP